MGIFLCAGTLILLLLWGRFRICLDMEEGRRGVMHIRIRFLGVPVYRMLYCVRFWHVSSLHLIQIKKHSARYFPLRLPRRKGKGKAKLRLSAFLGYLRRLDVRLRLGTGNAAQTAILCGQITQAGEVLRQTAGVPQASLCVQPDFDREGATLGVHGIVCFRIAEIIGTILQEKRQNHASD